MILFLLLIVASIWNSHIVGAAAPAVRAAAGIAPAARAAAIGRLAPEQLAGIRAVPTAQLTKPVTYSTWPTALQFNPGVALSWEPTVKSIYEHGTGNIQRLVNDPKVGMFNLVQNTFRTTQLPSNPFYTFSGDFAGKVAHAIRTGEIFNAKTVEELIQVWRKHHLAITGEKITEQRTRDAMNNILRAVEDEQFAGKLPEGTVANIITANQVMRDDAQQKLRDFYKQLGLDVTIDPTKKYTVEQLTQPLTTRRLYEDPTFYLAAYLHQNKGPETVPPRTYQTQNSYQGSASRPDCVEAMLREFIYHMLYDPETQSFDLKRLPSTIKPDPKLVEFFQKHSRATQAAANAASADFYALVADRRDIKYTNGNNEVQSDPENELNLLRQLFGLSEKEAPTWQALGEKLSTKELSVSIKESKKDADRTIYTFTITDNANKRGYTMGLDIRKGHSEMCMRPHFTAVKIPDIQQYSRLPEETGTALYPVVGVDVRQIKHPAQLGLLAQATDPRNVQTLNQGLAEALRQGNIDTALTFLNKYPMSYVADREPRKQIMGLLKSHQDPALKNVLKTLNDIDSLQTHFYRVKESSSDSYGSPKPHPNSAAYSPNHLIHNLLNSYWNEISNNAQIPRLGSTQQLIDKTIIDAHQKVSRINDFVSIPLPLSEQYNPYKYHDYKLSVVRLPSDQDPLNALDTKLQALINQIISAPTEAEYKERLNNYVKDAKPALDEFKKKVDEIDQKLKAWLPKRLSWSHSPNSGSAEQFLKRIAAAPPKDQQLIATAMARQVGNIHLNQDGPHKNSRGHLLSEYDAPSRKTMSLLRDELALMKGLLPYLPTNDPQIFDARSDYDNSISRYEGVLERGRQIYAAEEAAAEAAYDEPRVFE